MTTRFNMQFDDHALLKYLVVDAFNRQYGKNYQPEDFDIISIPHDRQNQYAFEIFTVRFDDYLRLRLYATIGNSIHVGKYVLREEPSHRLGLGDEVFVTVGQLDREYRVLSHTEISIADPEYLPDPSLLGVITGENPGITLIMEDGSFLLMEGAI